MTTGTSRYIIHDIAAFGRDVQNYNLLENSIETASGSTINPILLKLAACFLGWISLSSK
jgi:predicted RND superfamily exporter protein